LARPSLTLKLATTLDGRIALASGESRWITGEAARAAGRRLRAEHDAVLVGMGTALADDPLLTVRDPPGLQPLRVVMDSRARLPLTSRLVETAAEAPTVVITGPDAPTAELVQRGVRVLHAPLISGRIDAAAALSALAQLGVESVLLEGGGEVAAAFLGADLVDRLEWFRAPIILGGDARAGVGPLALERLSAAARWRRLDLRLLDDDVWESFVRERACSPES